MESRDFCTYSDGFIGHFLFINGSFFPAIFKRNVLEMNNVTLFLVKVNIYCKSMDEAKIIAKTDLVDSINEINIIRPNKEPMISCLIFFPTRMGYDMPGFFAARNVSQVTINL